MRRWRYWSGICLAACILSISPIVQAVDEPEEITEVKSRTDNSRADDWFSKQDDTESSDRGALGRAMDRKRQEQRQQADKKERYVFLFKDNGFAYYLDRQNARWKKIPYSEVEDILDVWIRLVKVDGAEEYSYPPKYYLEHYYLRPKTKQVQFLSELEVAGRPNNAIKERAYSARNWENLVSGSLEDELYHSVMTYMKRDPVNHWFKGKSLNDVLEETVRISI